MKRSTSACRGIAAIAAIGLVTSTAAPAQAQSVASSGPATSVSSSECLPVLAAVGTVAALGAAAAATGPALAHAAGQLQANANTEVNRILENLDIPREGPGIAGHDGVSSVETISALQSDLLAQSGIQPEKLAEAGGAVALGAAGLAALAAVAKACSSGGGSSSVGSSGSSSDSADGSSDGAIGGALGSIGGVTTGSSSVGTPGQDGDSPYIGENGNWWIGDKDLGVPARGPAGEDGATPTIGENGNWWINGVDTGVRAEGPAGTDGQDGVDGEDGQSAMIYMEDVPAEIDRCSIAPDSGGIKITTYMDLNGNRSFDEADEVIQTKFLPAAPRNFGFRDWQDHFAGESDPDYLVVDVGEVDSGVPAREGIVIYVGDVPADTLTDAKTKADEAINGLVDSGDLTTDQINESVRNYLIISFLLESDGFDSNWIETCTGGQFLALFNPGGTV